MMIYSVIEHGNIDSILSSKEDELASKILNGSHSALSRKVFTVLDYISYQIELGKIYWQLERNIFPLQSDFDDIKLSKSEVKLVQIIANKLFRSKIEITPKESEGVLCKSFLFPDISLMEMRFPCECTLDVDVHSSVYSKIQARL
ncbi:MAG: hypothetical protein VX777_00765 [Chlamydiota bacterium]|nr:hypothetical protein [Chlamydiota bacterium]